MLGQCGEESVKPQHCVGSVSSLHFCPSDFNAFNQSLSNINKNHIYIFIFFLYSNLFLIMIVTKSHGERMSTDSENKDQGVHQIVKDLRKVKDATSYSSTKK